MRYVLQLFLRKRKKKSRFLSNNPEIQSNYSVCIKLNSTAEIRECIRIHIWIFRLKRTRLILRPSVPKINDPPNFYCLPAINPESSSPLKKPIPPPRFHSI